MLNNLKALAIDESGATLVEYSLVVALIAVACIAALAFLGSRVKTMFSHIGNDLTAA